MIKSIYKFLNPKFQNLFLDYKVDFKPRYGHGLPPHKQLYEIISKNDATYQSLLKNILDNKSVFKAIKLKEHISDNIQPAWNNGFLPGLDMMALYTMISHFKPKKYIEIGSGNSTKIVYKAKVDLALETKIISIDPYPRAEIDQLADEIFRQPFETLKLDIINELESGDILFIDNSHRILPNSDCMVFFMEILPRLKTGVIVQIHDIYLPYDYPQFMCDRYYSEQYGLAFFLLANPNKYETILPCYYIFQNKKLQQIIDVIWEDKSMVSVEKHGGSYWLKVN